MITCRRPVPTQCTRSAQCSARPYNQCSRAWIAVSAHLTACDPRRVGEHALSRFAWHLVSCKHDGHDVLRKGLAVGLGVAVDKGAVAVDEVGHAQEGRARIDARRPHRRAESGAAAQIEHLGSDRKQCVDSRAHIDSVVREAIDEVRDKGRHESVEATARPNVAEPVDPLVEPIRLASWAQMWRGQQLACDFLGWRVVDCRLCHHVEARG